MIFNLNKKDLIKHLHQPEKITLDDLTELEELCERYPYFSLGHSLVAKATDHIGTPEKSDALKKAAVYTTDRGVLKKWMRQGADGIYPKRVIEQKPVEKIEIPVKKSTEEIASVGRKISFTDVPKPSTEKEVYQEVLENLKKLQTNLTVFDQAESDLLEKQEAEAKAETAKSSKKTPSKTVKKVVAAKAESTNALPAKTKTAKPKAASTKSPAKAKKPSTTASTQKKSKNQNIEKSRAETEPKVGIDIMEELLKMEGREIANEKLKAQINIIDQFIKAEPSISRKNPSEAYEPSNSDVQDLTGDLNSLGDDLLSENLAIILEKQGKYDRAIDIYKKLIWKFPQKKAYFAGRIEELTK